MIRTTADIPALRAEFKIQPLEAVKRKLIHRALKAAKGNKYLAADLLGVNYRTFRAWTQGVPASGRKLKGATK